MMASLANLISQAFKLGMRPAKVGPPITVTSKSTTSGCSIKPAWPKDTIELSTQLKLNEGTT